MNLLLWASDCNCRAQRITWGTHSIRDSDYSRMCKARVFADYARPQAILKNIQGPHFEKLSGRWGAIRTVTVEGTAEWRLEAGPHPRDHTAWKACSGPERALTDYGLYRIQATASFCKLGLEHGWAHPFTYHLCYFCAAAAEWL